MSLLTRVIEQRLAQGSKCFVAYLTAGDPNLEATPKLVTALVKGGADIIELGIPFSDPLADGPTNQRAAERALKQGVSLQKVLDVVPEIKQRNPNTPIVIFSYMNPIFAMGFEAFADQAKAKGVDAVLVVDLPPEESVAYRSILQARGLSTIFLASPTSNAERLALVDSCSNGFVYYVSRTGVTGVQTQISSSLVQEMALVKRTVQNPVMIGFGVSNGEQARTLAGQAEGVIIGSAIVKLIEDANSVPAAERALEDFARSIRGALP